jgi:hypothetical protein
MKTYYTHNGNENEGPFDFEELKSKKINKATPVWCAGMDDWKRAGEVEELKSIFITVPPPIKYSTSIPPTPENKKKGKNQKILGLSKSNVLIATGVLILVILLLVTNHLQENRKASLEQKNSLTEKNNHQYQLQQKEIQEQKNGIAEQERLELQRTAQLEKQTINNLILDVKNSLSINYSKLKEAKVELNDASNFQFFRTPDQRIEDIGLAQNNIESLKNEIAALEKKIDLLYLKLEKIR